MQTGDHFASPAQRPAVERAEAGGARPGGVRRLLRQDIVDLVSVAWLGPNYQIVSEPNVVNPGGTAQTAHRDYHLGFMDLDLAAQYPAHVHRLSPVLTLQGAVAHVDMGGDRADDVPAALAEVRARLHGVGLPEFQEYFEAHYVQLPLEKGDAVFFNPALLHGGARTGPRTSSGWRTCCRSRRRSAGRWTRRPGTVAEAVYPTLRARKAAGAPRRTCTTSSPRPPRATPSRRTWTATRRSAR